MREHNYAEGFSYGLKWAQEDRSNSVPASEELTRIREEAASDQRWARAFYLGALRGYREIARTLRDGRWGT